MEELQKKYDTLVGKYNALLAENEELKSILLQHGIAYSASEISDKEPIFSPVIFPSVNFTPDEKIALFSSFFKGRTDVFARRWFSRTTGKGGYQPVCTNEWRRGVCDKKRYKCSDCPNRNLAPLTSREIYRHLEGKDEYGCDVIGLYAVTPDNKCSFLCADFDDKNCTRGYKEDVLAFTAVCRNWGIPYSIERSRSGNGAHVWIFFEEPVAAGKARKLGNAILTEAMKRNGHITFNSYDRFFPNQDRMPEGGFGNLIALPLQGRARKMGNSVFVDENFLQFKNQWAYLYNVKKLNEHDLDMLLVQHRQEDFGSLATSSETKPWVLPVSQDVTQKDFNGKLKIKKSDRLYIPLNSISEKVANHLKRIAAFKNPEFYSKQAMRISTYNIPRIICRADFTDDYLALPRGCEDAVTTMLESLGVAYEMIDETNHGKPVAVAFKGKERDEQLDAINSLMPYTVANHLKRIAAFKNPEFYSKQAMRISTYNIPRIICRADFTDDYLALPRGCEDAVTTMLESLGVAYEMIDETNHGKPVAVAFKGKERDEQLDAINSLMPYTNGVLAATTAFGKTVTAAALIARKKVSTLVLVHSKALLLQWHERLTDFLEIEFAEPATSRKRGRKKVFSPIGCLDSTSNTLHGVIDIALMQSCFENGEVRPFVREYGMVIVDECHHVSSITFENVLRHITAHHVYGLTATPIRKDGLQPIIFMQCGPIRFSADAKTQIQKQSFLRYLVPRFTSYRSVTENRQSFALLSQSLAESELRNTLIVEDVLNAVTAGRTPIILTGRTSHVKLLSEMLKPHISHVIQLTGEGTAKSKREILQGLHDIPQNSPLVIVATGKYVGEGFDYPRLDTLFLALPISWKGLVAQYAGRLHRENEGKADVRIYDYIDIHEPVCESMYRKRLKGYSVIGYRVLSKDCQTLFDATEGLQSSPHEEQIFNGITFCHPFIKELKASRQSIVISSPKLYHMERNKFVNILKELQRDGIEVAILTLTENEQSDYLRRQGLFVKIVPELSLCSCVMDKSSVWYGSINILGYPTEEDNIIRIKDIRLAEEFLDVIYNNGNGK